MSEMVHKIILGSGKEVLLRPFKIKHQKLAARIASKDSNGDIHVLGMLMQDEIIKQLIVQINGKEPSKTEIEDLDGLFEPGEYRQIIKVLGKMTGEDDVDPKLEVVSIGKQ